MTLGAKAIAATVAMLLLMGGIAAGAVHERTVGARAATIAVQDSISKAQGAIAAQATHAARIEGRRADSLASIVRADSFTIAKLRAIGPQVIHVPVSPAPGKPPVLTAVVPEADYDALALSAAKAASDASKALAAKDSLIRADSAALAAMQRRHSADSLIIAAIGPTKPSTGFWSHFHVGPSASAIAALDDRRLHWGPGVSITWTR